MRHAMLADGGVDVLRDHLAQAHTRPGHGGQGPRIAPAIAMKQRQGPQVDRNSYVQPRIEGGAERIEIGRTVVVNHALGVAVVPEV